MNQKFFRLKIARRFAGFTIFLTPYGNMMRQSLPITHAYSPGLAITIVYPWDEDWWEKYQLDGLIGIIDNGLRGR